MRRTALIIFAATSLAACSKDRKPDAYGTFEANEVVVSTEVPGFLVSFTPAEGAQLSRGAVVGLVDTIQLGLEREQIIAQRQTTASRSLEVSRQIGVLEAQREVARRAYERTRRLFEQKAATAQQLDQAERDYRVLLAQIAAAQAQKASVASEINASTARVAQISERLSRTQIRNPQTGTVLATFVRTGEVVQQGQALYRIANLDTLTLRAYVSETQLHAIRVGQEVQVNVDGGDGKLIAIPGRLSWVSAKAEFTPTPVQTRDERADLVYAVKVLVPNRGGLLKIGMPADVTLAAPASRT
jgi:HlyD family secretion protein